MSALRTPQFTRRFAAASGLALACLLAPGSASAGGFAQPILVLPETGLWADGFAELGYGREPGLVVYWGLDRATARGFDGARDFDWASVSYRVRVEVFNANGKRVANEERLVDPPGLDTGLLVGGFPAAVHVLLRHEGEYRVRLEAYPLVDPAAAGLDSIPRNTVQVTATLTGSGLEHSAWQVSDILLLRNLTAWKPGTTSDRTWYEWAVDPAVSRILEADSSGSYLAFEVQRGRELVPQCQRTNCRVVVTIYDEAGGMALQTLRPVPEPFAVSAYVVPIETGALEEGAYVADVEVYEGNQKRTSERRGFRVRSSDAQRKAAPASSSEAGSASDSP